MGGPPLSPRATEGGAAIEHPREAPASSAAFADFYRNHHCNVYRFVRARIGHDVVAEDVTAETFLKALAKRETFEGLGSYRSWVLAIAANTTTTWRSRERRWTDLDSVADPVDPAAGPAASLIAREERLSLRRAVETLPKAQREAITLHYFQGLSIDQVARTCGRSEGAVRVLLHRARHRLRKELQARPRHTR